MLKEMTFATYLVHFDAVQSLKYHYLTKIMYWRLDGAFLSDFVAVFKSSTGDSWKISNLECSKSWSHFRSDLVEWNFGGLLGYRVSLRQIPLAFEPICCLVDAAKAKLFFPPVKSKRSTSAII